MILNISQGSLLNRISKLKTFIILNTFAFASFFGTAQPLYTRSIFDSPYVPITVVTGATVSTATGNDVNQTAIPLGFTFSYEGIPYTELGLNTNGLIWFDATAPSASVGANNSYLVRDLAPNKCITAWWADMIDDASSDILYQSQGLPGNRTFTVQFTNYPFSSVTNGTNIRINTQVIFYENGNIIEFRYGSVSLSGGIIPTTGSATIGIEYGTGGPGNYIDAITGSTTTSHRALNPLSGWPSYNIRFTPGSPTPVSGGTYNVGIGQHYPSLSRAISDLNHRGISGAVTLNLTDALYDTSVVGGKNIFPLMYGPVAGVSSANTITISKSGSKATIAYRGVTDGDYGSGSNYTIYDQTDEPVIGISGSWLTLRNLNIVSHGANQLVDIGILLHESEGAVGSKYNYIDNCRIDMNRANTSSVGIYIRNITNPGGFTSSNSYNTVRDIEITDCQNGILMIGAGGVYVPDVGNKVISSSCTKYNMIGDPAIPNDIGGNANTTAYGIQMVAQNACEIRNNIISNVVSNHNTAGLAGIALNGVGVCNISNNIIRNIRRNHATSTTKVSGIRLTNSHNGNYVPRIYNNMISEITCGYTGTATGTKIITGIFIDETWTANIRYEIYNNSVSIDGSASPNASNSCLEFQTSGAYSIIKNNILANYTSAQTGVASHFCISSPTTNQMGSFSTECDYNDYYIHNDQGISGYVGLGGSTKYATVADWRTAMTMNPGIDLNSFSANPNFVNPLTNLHASSTSTAINGTGTNPPTYSSQDIDCEPRSSPYDIGADDFDIALAPAVAGTFDPSGAGSLCGIAYDTDNNFVWIYGCSAVNIQKYSTTGTLLQSITSAGPAANDVDVEIAPENLTLKNGAIQKGQVLFVNGESGVARIYAYHPVTNAVTDTLVTSFGNSHVVGGSYHPARNTFFLVQDNIPGVADENKIAEINPVTGAILNTFQTTGTFNISFGDVEVGGNGNLFIVSSDENRIAEYTATGTFIQYHMLPAGVSSLSGIAMNCDKSEIWVSSTSGTVHRISNFPCSADVSLQLGLFIQGLYEANGEMTPVLLNSGISTNSSECDSITVELRNPLNTSEIIDSWKTILHTDGNTTVYLPDTYLGQSYYLCIRHRNSVETWSKTPITISQFNSYDFRIRD